jgi:5'-3' exonuclease
MRLHLIDGTFEIFRAHFSKRPGHEDPQGRDRKATLGLVYSLLSLLDDHAEAPTHLAVAFDNPIRSFRNDLFAGYKSDEGVPPELLDQLDIAEVATKAIGLAVWSMRDFEADDALASGAAAFVDQVDQVRILSPDKDLGQCLRDRKVVQLDRIRSVETDEAALIQRRGVPPAAIPDLLGLVGDDADQIPGVPGFGEKTAAALLQAFGSLEAIPDDPGRWPPTVRGRERLAKALAGMRPEAALYKKLATLRTDAPIDRDLEALRWRGVPRAAFLEFCEEIGASESLQTRKLRWQ